MSDQNPHPGDIRHSQIPVGCPTPPPSPLGLDIDRNIIVTQRFVLFSQQESDRQQNTCVFLKRQNEQMQEDCDELNEQIQSLKVYNW